MSKEKIIQAWKNEQYRQTLSAAEQAALPTHPAGLIELDDAALGDASGAEEVTVLIFCASFDLDCDSTIFNSSCKLWSWGCCRMEDYAVAP
ncbi:MAG TPA: mersacidin/lichenicidin family type 2 lantibiotic [Thermoanaerobaculia bacterium]|nr:mersacidin/lichenicidin family type 2 lantibiotic [Thermoanaerobaculia bacterium]